MKTVSKIKLTLSPLDNKLELTSKIFLGVMWMLTVYTFLKLPEIIPVHFNAFGQADDFGNKLALLILPIIATIIYFGLTHSKKCPTIFYYMTKTVEKNTEKQYIIASKILRFLKLVILLIFSFMILFIYLTTIGMRNRLAFLFLILTVGLLLMLTVISISQALRKSNVI